MKATKQLDNGISNLLFTDDGNPLGSVSVVPSENYIGAVGNKTAIISTEITTTHTQAAYAANDAVLVAGGGASALAGVARVAGGTAFIFGLRLTTNKKSIVPAFRLHLFNAANPTVSADNAAWQDKYADISKRLGYIDLPAMTTAADTTNSDMSRSVVASSPPVLVACAAGQTGIWWALETLTAFTPDNDQKFTLVAQVLQN